MTRRLAALVAALALAAAACLDPDLRRLAFKALAVGTQCVSEHQGDFWPADAGAAAAGDGGAR